MKRVGHLFDRIAERGNVAAAVWRAARGKRGRAEVAAFLENADAEIGRIVDELRSERYAYRSFAVRDTKRRTIHAPPFRDRVVHHALLAVAGPVLERGAIAYSYACRTGRGQHACLAQLRRWVRRGDWFLKADVEKFYDTLPHEELLRLLGRRFSECRLIGLWERLLGSSHTAPGRGLPIGALSSQYLGNFYLDVTDHFCTQGLRARRYLRYMDDMLLLGDPDEVRHARGALDEHLALRGLRLKDGGVLNRAGLGIPWLGMTVYPGRMRLGAGGRRRLRRKFRETEARFAAGAIGERERPRPAGGRHPVEAGSLPALWDC